MGKETFKSLQKRVNVEPYALKPRESLSQNPKPQAECLLNGNTKPKPPALENFSTYINRDHNFQRIGSWGSGFRGWRVEFLRPNPKDDTTEIPDPEMHLKRAPTADCGAKSQSEEPRNGHLNSTPRIPGSIRETLVGAPS